MKHTIIVAVLLLLMISSSNAAVESQTQETVIHILIVRDSDTDETEIVGQIEFLDLTWFNTAFSGLDPTEIAFVASGDTFAVPGGLNGSLATQIEQVKFYVNSRSGSIPTVRENQAADVVIAFTKSLRSAAGSTVCGFAPQDNWSKNPQNPSAPEFVDPDNDGLDLRGRDDKDGKIGYYVALVAVDPPCEGGLNWYNAAHEFGHLLGGGHYDLPYPDHQWLLPNSRAFGWLSQEFKRVRGHVTALADAFPSICNNSDTCRHVKRYSDFDSATGTSDRRNAEAMDLTARSVANYMLGVPALGAGGTGARPPPSDPAQCEDGMDNDGDSLVDLSDPGCDTAADDNETDDPPPPPAPEGCDPAAYVPVNVRASLRETCVPGTSQSSYDVRWDHACFGGFYAIWGTTSGRGTYHVGNTSAQSALLNVIGPPSTSYVQISACNSSGFCSALSSPPVPLTDFC